MAIVSFWHSKRFLGNGERNSIIGILYSKSFPRIWVCICKRNTFVVFFCVVFTFLHSKYLSVWGIGQVGSFKFYLARQNISIQGLLSSNSIFDHASIVRVVEVWCRLNWIRASLSKLKWKLYHFIPLHLTTLKKY